MNRHGLALDTTIGLMMLPKSSTAVKFTIWTSPVSGVDLDPSQICGARLIDEVRRNRRRPFSSMPGSSSASG